MKFKLLILFVLAFFALSAYSQDIAQSPNLSSIEKQEVIDPDSLLKKSFVTVPKRTEKTAIKQTDNKPINIKQTKFDVSAATPESETEYFKIPAYIEPVKIDSLLLLGNPFFIDLVFMGYPNNFKFHINPDYRTLYFGKKAVSLDNFYFVQPQKKTNEQIISDLRAAVREEISRTEADVYILTFDELPDPNGTKSRFLEHKSLANIRFVDDSKVQRAANRKLIVKAETLGPWTTKASGLAQFSENFVSPNWYQGGSPSVAILGILTGQLNYDDKKCVQWENNAEWRLGFNSVEGDTTRFLNTNDDVLRINSKLGVKAGGNFFYSGSVDFSTQFFNSYKGINSLEKKATFLTPVRLNVGMGLDYKYKKLFSLMLSPVSFKYIYIDETDAKKINPNLFGIKTGENHLSEIGSSFKAQCSFSPFRELQLDSRFSFYTNYQKVEIDCEVVGNFIVNRYLSTRISLNPRYDNTVIFKPGEKAKLQFKELLSFGFSYKLLN